MRIDITGVRLKMEMDGERRRDAVVFIEAGGKWFEIVRERVDGAFDHIVNDSGIEKAICGDSWQSRDEENG